MKFFKSVEENKTIKEVSKSQAIRVVDVLYLGPLMIWLSRPETKLTKNTKFILGFFGATTIWYNARNFYENWKRNNHN